MRKLKQSLKKVVFKLPAKYIRAFYYLYNFVVYPDMRETHKKYGKANQNIIFYVIRPRTDCVEGLMALLFNVIKQLYYAEQRGYIPVVDFEHYITQYLDASVSNKNVWEYYFEQTSSFSLDEVYNSSNVILSGITATVKVSDKIDQIFDSYYMNNAKKIFRKYITISNDVVKIADAEMQLWNMKETLGLYLRGTDYIKLKPAGHPIQPTFEEAVKVADAIKEKHKLQKVFLVTEDAELYKKAAAYYGEDLLLVSFDTFIADYNGDGFLSKSEDYKNQLASSPYSRGLNYLVKLLILAKCHSFVGGNTCGSWATCVMNQEYVERYIFDLGRY